MSDSNLEMTGVSAVVWTDDDGTTYRRTMRDGEIVDEPVSDKE